MYQSTVDITKMKVVDRTELAKMIECMDEVYNEVFDTGVIFLSLNTLIASDKLSTSQYLSCL